MYNIRERPEDVEAVTNLGVYMAVNFRDSKEVYDFLKIIYLMLLKSWYYPEGHTNFLSIGNRV